METARQVWLTGKCEAACDLCTLPGEIPEALAENAGVNKSSHKGGGLIRMSLAN